jgi:hypothetical protein
MSQDQFYSIRNFERFPFRIRQPPECDWCIPASIEAVTKYHEPNSLTSQNEIAKAFHTKEVGFGLAHVETVLCDSVNFGWVQHFQYEDKLTNFQDLANKIEITIRDSTPSIISIPVGIRQWHMLVPVAYNKTYFRVYDPNPHLIGAYCDVEKGLIEAMLRDRKGAENSATDILVLLPKTRPNQK